MIQVSLSCTEKRLDFVTTCSCVLSSIGKRYPSDKEEFYCWMCHDYTDVDVAAFIKDCKVRQFILPEDDMLDLFVERTVRLIEMIQKASGGYKRLKIAGYKENGDGSKQLYCTPLNVVSHEIFLVEHVTILLQVCFLRTLLMERFSPLSQCTCIDLGAGTGNLSSVLPSKSISVEKEQHRYALGKKRLPRLQWTCKVHIFNSTGQVS